MTDRLRFRGGSADGMVVDYALGGEIWPPSRRVLVRAVPGRGCAAAHLAEAVVLDEIPEDLDLYLLNGLDESRYPDRVAFYKFVDGAIDLESH